MAGTVLGVLWEATILQAHPCLMALAELFVLWREEGSPSTPTLQAEWEEFLARSYRSWKAGRKKHQGVRRQKEGGFLPTLPALSH